GDGTLWTATHDGGQVLRIDPQAGRPTATTPIAGQGTAIAAAGDAIWAVGWKHAMYRIDPSSGRVDRTMRLPRPDQIAVAGDRLWVTNWQRSTVSGVDPASGRVTTTLHA